MKTKELIEELRFIEKDDCGDHPGAVGVAKDAADRLEAIIGAWEAWNSSTNIAKRHRLFIALQHAITGE